MRWNFSFFITFVINLKHVPELLFFWFGEGFNDFSFFTGKNDSIFRFQREGFSRCFWMVRDECRYFDFEINIALVPAYPGISRVLWNGFFRRSTHFRNGNDIVRVQAETVANYVDSDPYCTCPGLLSCLEFGRLRFRSDVPRNVFLNSCESVYDRFPFFFIFSCVG